jgi:hypothetical protein
MLKHFPVRASGTVVELTATFGTNAPYDMTGTTRWSLAIEFAAGTGHVSELEIIPYWCHTATGTFLAPGQISSGGVVTAGTTFTTGDVGSGEELNVIIGGISGDSDDAGILGINGFPVIAPWMKISWNGTGTATGSDLGLNLIAW